MKKLLVLLSLIFACISAHADTFNQYWYNGSVLYAQTTCQTGGNISLPAIAPTKYGHDFVGWEKMSYTSIEYLESTGTQYIDTGVKFYADNSTEVVLDGEFIDKSDNLNQHICTIGGNTKYVWFGNYNSKNFSYGQGSFGSTAVPLTSTPPISAKIYKNTFTISDNVNSYSYNNGTYDTVYDGALLPLFARAFDANLQSVSCSKARVSNFKIIVNDVLVRDFIPVLDSYGTPCMYDKVENKFYYNQGTGDFIAGPRLQQ